MWHEQYKKTLAGTQLVIIAMAASLYFASGRNWLVGAFAFVVMQGGAIAGAMVAARLRRRLRLNG